MKKITLVLLTFAMAVLGTNVSAQNRGKYGADSAECIKYLSCYQDYYKQKDYDDALPNWRKAYKLCPPTASENMLIMGSTLLRNGISKATDPKVQAAMIDTLLTLQDQRAATYPKHAETALNNKAMYIAQYFKDPQKLHTEFEKIIAVNKENVTPNILLLNLNSTIDLYKNKKLGAEDVINTYQNAMALIDKMPASEDTEKAKTDVQSLFITSQVASCDNLIALFTPRFEANPKDTALVTNIVTMLASTEGCQNNDLFLKAVTAMHDNKPSAASAYYLYKLHSAKDETATAVKYLEEAISTEGVESKIKADYEFELATYCLKNGMNGTAFEYARKAAEQEPSFQGKSYYLIGTIWGSVSCGGDEVAKRAHFWVAVDYLQKAKSADPSLTADANRLIGQYSVYYPQKAEAFMYDVVDGQSYTVNCGGMHATTVVRTQK